LLLTLNKPEALNAINSQMATDLIDATRAADEVSDIGCMVITGWPKVFAAGADISEMAVRPYDEMYAADWFEQWEGFTAVRASRLSLRSPDTLWAEGASWP
jgi:enoyl-CoA hydratase